MAPADRRRQVGRPRHRVPAPKISARTLDEVEALAGAGFDYLFNSVKWWDFESPWLLDQYEQFRHIAPSIGFPESHDTERLVTELLAAGFPESEIEARYRQAYAFAAAFSTGVMMPMGFEYGWARRISVVPQDAETPEPPRFDLSAVYRRRQSAESGGPGAQRGGAAAAAVAAERSASLRCCGRAKAASSAP